MTISTITPEEARRLLTEGAILVDIREADEYAREHIPGSRHWPLSRIDDAGLVLDGARCAIFHCRSGARTLANAGRLAAELGGACDAYIVEGGLDAWRKAGLPVNVDHGQPLELQRQVQIGAGLLALAGTALAILASPVFFIVPAFVGGGLLLAGLTGFCGMARLLLRAPWNRTLMNARRNGCGSVVASRTQ